MPRTVGLVMLILAGLSCTAGEGHPGVDEASAAASSGTFVGEDCAPNAFSWLETPEHVGESVAVLGRVVGWSHELPTDATSTFLYLGTSSPLVERLTIEIPTLTAQRFTRAPGEALSGRAVCVFGRVERGADGPLIQIEQPEQITRVNDSSIGTATSSEYDAALAKVSSEGFVPLKPEETFCSECTMHVILGICAGAVSSDCQRAFFFVGSKLVGKDPGSPKYEIHVLRQDAVTTMLGFVLVRVDQPRCCASSGEVEVRFQWDGSRLKVLDAMPASGGDLAPNF